MSKRLTPFESILKEKMEDYQASYDVKSWYNIEKKMGNHAKSNSPWIVALVATCLVSSAIGLSLHNYKHNSSRALALNNSEKRFESVSADNIRSTRATAAQSYLAEIIENNESPVFSSKTNSVNKGSLANNPIGHTNEISNSSTVELPATPSLPAAGGLAFESNMREGCAGVEIDFKATNGPTSGSYLWNFGDGRFSSEANPRHKFNKAGKYDVSLSVTSNDGQIRTVVLNDLITIFPAPDANFEWNFLTETAGKVSVQIINTSNNANQYEWKFEDGTATTMSSPVKVIGQNGKHAISLHVSNEFGCKDDVVKQISVNTDFNVGASSSFHPEKEDYMPVGLKSKDLNFELTIYNPNGQIVHQTSSYNKGWNGKLADGTMANSGQYRWTVVLTGSRSEQKYFNGVFTVFP